MNMPENTFNYEGIHTPVLEYLKELDKLYINGHFMATIVFSSTILEYLLRQKLYLVADVRRVDKAGLGTLCTMAKRLKVLSKNEAEQVYLVNKMRNTILHMDMDFAKELMSWANPEIEDPYTQMSWFSSGTQFSLMAGVCADIARTFAVNYSTSL